ncbi:hypothetical protein I302_107861 [Kwoniella bestiolae CBS 10118]|uniref:Uncharacterized protein n=1 Tax=Kwoniella bestiolae CBS 10118 TaxID=1296100 RepID=A0A1B9FXC7_9TREE|nr:hypothetical protein I302_06398 [Kwoniella bestiolae CBS 10118]OCF23417.1 hypothetical protein I302_06398 [Kwoniella bestiolae CBS 10118]
MSASSSAGPHQVDLDSYVDRVNRTTARTLEEFHREFRESTMQEWDTKNKDGNHNWYDAQNFLAQKEKDWEYLSNCFVLKTLLLRSENTAGAPTVNHSATADSDRTADSKNEVNGDKPLGDRT